MNRLVHVLAASTFALAAACGSASESAGTTAGSEGTSAPSQDLSNATASVNDTGSSTNTTPATIVGRTAAPASAGGTTTPSGAPATTDTPPATPVPYRGVNLSGGEFGSALPGTDGVDYRFPNNAEVDYFAAKGMNTFRVGFKWERLQPAAYGELVTAYVAQLDALVAHATEKNANVILNPHNFARYYGSTVGSTQVPNAVFADLWSRLASRFKGNAHVMFNLVNEPNSMPTEQWVGAANAAISAIRAAGASNVIIVPGNAWTGAYSWYSNSYGTPNAVALLDIVDPSDNLLYEVHQYLDASTGGQGADCVSTTIGSERLAPFVKWLRDNHKRGFVGEFAGGDNPTCNAAVTDMLAYMTSASDVLDGFLWWGAGPGWGEYMFTVEPKNGADRPQMALLQPYLF